MRGREGPPIRLRSDYAGKYAEGMLRRPEEFPTPLFRAAVPLLVSVVPFVLAVWMAFGVEGAGWLFPLAALAVGGVGTYLTVKRVRSGAGLAVATVLLALAYVVAAFLVFLLWATTVHWE